MTFEIRVATTADVPAIRYFISASVLALQPEYTYEECQKALETVFSIDSRLISDGTYFVAFADGMLAGCGGWSFRKTLYGGDHQIEGTDPGLLDSATDAAKIRAIFVSPAYARKGLGSLLLKHAEDAAKGAGFTGFEMGSTLAGIELYRRSGYTATESIRVSVGAGLSIEIVRMRK